MTSIHDLDLFELPIATAEFGTDPLPWFARARERHDWLAASEIGFVLTRYRAVETILRLDDKLNMPGEQILDIMGAQGTGWGDFCVEQMLVSSGERHARLRGSVRAAFSPARVKLLRPLMRETVRRILDEWAPRGAFDFTEFAGQFPVRVMFALLGTPIDRLPAIIKDLETHGESFNLEVEKMPEIEAGYQRLWAFVDGLVAERRREGARDDLLDALIAANDGGQVDDKELCQLLILLFAAGYDTTKNLLILLMRSMLDNPDIYRRAGEDFDYARQVVKEQLRYATPSNTMRMVTEGFTFEGVEIPAGTMLVFPMSLSGRDPEVFADPDRFGPARPERDPSQ
ncbi:MAG: cytochrome P450, partial [Sphingomonadales bacterium]|nr:cytochrome P450 [Sphingomonadales bacterium]